MCCSVTQACLNVCDPMEGVAKPSSRGSSWPRDQTHITYISCTGRQVVYHRCHLGSPKKSMYPHTFYEKPPNNNAPTDGSIATNITRPFILLIVVFHTAFRITPTILKLTKTTEKQRLNQKDKYYKYYYRSWATSSVSFQIGKFERVLTYLFSRHVKL